jgi:predicted phosphodiesterase
MPRVLVIGDSHVDENQNLYRFAALGAKIKAECYDYVVIIGDFLSFNCLSDWDRNKRLKMENKRYFLEIQAGNCALDLLGFDGKQKCKVVYVEGNHEERLPRYLAHDPTFSGFASLYKDLKLDVRNITFVPYKEVYTIKGVSFTHIPIASNGKPVGNPNVAQKALKLFATSIVFGHTHTLDHAAEHRHGAPHLNQALSVGCFFEHVDEYAQGSLTNYWRGVVDLNIYSDNRFDFQTTSMRQLFQTYGSKSLTSTTGVYRNGTTSRTQRNRRRAG